MTAVVVAAAVVRHGRLLAAQRSYPPELDGCWELPGGKTEPGEDETEALVRECVEELGVTVEVGARVGPEILTVGPGLPMRTYLAVLTSDAEPQARTHRALRWLARDELLDVDWLEADLPVVRAIAALPQLSP